MAALNKCNPAQLLILHIIKFLIYTLCFRGPTHNSLVLNSRGIKTNARRALGRRHLPGLTVPAAGAGRKAREGRRAARAAEAGARASPGGQACAACGASSAAGEEVPSPSRSLLPLSGRAPTHNPHAPTRGWPRGAPSRSGLLGRHLPVGGFQTSRESQKLHGLQTPESLAGPGPVPHLRSGPLCSAWGQEPTKGQNTPGEIRGARGSHEVLFPF